MDRYRYLAGFCVPPFQSLKTSIGVLFILLVITKVPAHAERSALNADALGPHGNYGRGCSECHVPRSPEVRVIEGDRVSVEPANVALWGEAGTSEQGIDGSQTAPARVSGASGDATEPTGIVACLSCHDGNFASAAMSKNAIYESLPQQVYGAIDPVPTFMDKPSEDRGSDIQQHPVGTAARMGCSGPGSWDCTERDGRMVMDGPRSSMFAANYGFFLDPLSNGKELIVVCSTCHNPHSRVATSVGGNARSNYFRAGIYSTRFFLRAPYDPASVSRTGNIAAQFCRQCHAVSRTRCMAATSPRRCEMA